MTLEQRIRSDIEARIASGEWRPGHRIPFEHELVAHYGCARATVGKALAGLARAGLIERRRKAGSFVAHRHAESAVLDIPNIAAVVEARGGGYRFELLRSRRIDGRGALFAKGEALLAIDGLHHAADGPFAHEARLISLASAPEAAAVDFSAEPPGAWLLGHVPWSEAQHRICAVAAQGETARLLDLRAGTPCLQVERITWRGGKPVTRVRQTFPGDRYDLVARFTPAAR